MDPVNGAPPPPGGAVIEMVAVGAVREPQIVLKRREDAPLGLIVMGNQPVGFFLDQRKATLFACGPVMRQLVQRFVEVLNLNPNDEQAARELRVRLSHVVDDAMRALEQDQEAIRKAETPVQEQGRIIDPRSGGVMPIGKLFKP